MNLFDIAYNECDKLKCEEGELLIPANFNAKTAFQCIGSISQPMLIDNNCFKFGKDSLTEGEKNFIISFLNYLVDDFDKYMDKKTNKPKEILSPIQKDDKYYYIYKIHPRGEKQPSLRIDDSDNFYPDFMIWITNKDQTQQDILFVDPKGLRSIEEGWSNYKILSFIYVVHELQYQIMEQIKESNIKVNFRGVMLSSKETYDEFDNAGFYILRGEKMKKPSEEEFKKAGIFFFNESGNTNKYPMEDIFKYATSSTQFSNCMKYIACKNLQQDTDEIDLDSEIKYYIDWYSSSQRFDSKSELVSNIIIKLLSSENITATVKKICKKELVKFQEKNMLIFNENINDIDCPCKALFMRAEKQHKEFKNHLSVNTEDNSKDIV